LKQLLTLLEHIRATHATYAAGIFAKDCAAIASALGPAKQGRLATAWALCVDKGFRKARRDVRQLRRHRNASSKQLLEEVLSSAHELSGWRAWSPESREPPVPPLTAGVRAQLDALAESLEEVGTRIGRSSLWDATLPDVTALFAKLSADRDTAYRIPRLLELEKSLHSFGVERVIQELRGTPRLPELWPKVFQFAWLTSCLELARTGDPE